MGLIDDIRKKRDSWESRLEEQRLENDSDEQVEILKDKELEEKMIKKNLQNVGKFPPREDL